MSKEIKNVKEEVMSQIHQGKLKMRPKIYFVISSILAFFGVVISIVTSTFIFGLISFSIRSRSPMAGFKVWRLLSDFPWWLVFIAILGLAVGIYLLRRYDFSYKINFKIAIVALVLVIIISGWFIDLLGFNDLMVRHGPMQGVMKQYFQEQQTPPRFLKSEQKNSVFPDFKKSLLPKVIK